MAVRNLEVVIRAKDLYTKVLNKSQQATLGFSKAVTFLRRNWIATSIAIVGAIATITKAWNLAFAAAKFQQQEQAFANLAASHGANSKTIINNLNEMAAETISTADLMQSAGTALLLGIPAERLVKMMEIARSSSRITGQSTRAAFNDIAKGMGRQSKLILDNLGIIIRVEDANKAYAKSLNITGRALTDAEKKQAFFDATMESGEDTIRRVGELQATSAEAMQRMTAKYENFKIVAGKAIIFMASVIEVVHDSIIKIFANIMFTIQAGIGTIIRAFADMLLKVGDILSKIPKIGGAFAKLPDIAGDSMSLLADDVDKFTAVLERSVAVSQKNLIISVDTATAIWREVVAIKAKTKAKDEEAFRAAQGPGAIGAEGGEQLLQDSLGPTMVGMNTRLEEMALFHDQKIALLTAQGGKEKEIAAQLAQKDVSMTAQTEQMKLQFRQKGFGMATGIMKNLFVATGSSSKALFTAMKVSAVAQAIMDARVAVVGAYKWGTRLGGPVVGAAFAAAAVAATAAQIKGIISQKMGGGSTSTPSISSSVPVAHGGAQPIPTREVAQAQQAQNVVVNIYNPLSEQNWDEIIENNIVPAINAAAERNVNIEVRTVAA